MTTPCIGWEGDEACEIHGQFHGCHHHRGTGKQWAFVHVCLCGAECSERQLRAKTPRMSLPPVEIGPPAVSQQSEPGSARTLPAPANATKERQRG